MATIMGIIADRHLLDIKDTKLEITKKMEENPRRVGEIRVDLHFPKNNFSDANKLLLENAAKTCPVAKSLHPDVKQVIKFNW
jgi:putative redox protein